MPHPKENIEFRKHHGNSYEAVIVNSFSGNQPIFKLALNIKLEEWPSKDLFMPDPHHNGFWIYDGRVDDIIILTTGATLKPTGCEQHLYKKNPIIKGVMMYRNGRMQPSLLVELEEEAQKDICSAQSSLRSCLEECNSMFPPQMSIKQTHILFTTPEKPLPRSAKGTIQRKRAVNLYQMELDLLYKVA